MDRTTLNQKTWYRALKVLFVLAFILSQLIGLAITGLLVSDKVSFVHCDNGKEFESPYIYGDDEAKLTIFKRCDITAFLLNKTDVKGVLTDAQMNELREQITRIQDGGALQSEMQSAVDNYKQKFADRTPSALATKSYTTEELSKVFGHDVGDSFKVGDSHWISNFNFEYKDKYSLAEKGIRYLISFTVVSILFWLINRTFFYIFAREKFLKLPRRLLK